MNRLILDTDGGVDDAQALLLLIANGRPPDAITTVFGNVDLDTATDNVLTVLAVAGVSIDVHKGAPEPLEEEIVIHAREVHGDDGLGGAPRPHTIAEIAGSDGSRVQHKIGGLLADHDRRRVGVATRDRRDDRGVRHAQSLDPAHLEVGTDDG